MLKAMHAAEYVAAARENAGAVIEKLKAMRLIKAADLVEASIGETLTYYAFPEEHRRRIRTNNPLERLMREIRISRTSNCGNPSSATARPQQREDSFQ